MGKKKNRTILIFSLLCIYTLGAIYIILPKYKEYNKEISIARSTTDNNCLAKTKIGFHLVMDGLLKLKMSESEFEKIFTFDSVPMLIQAPDKFPFLGYDNTKDYIYSKKFDKTYRFYNFNSIIFLINDNQLIDYRWKHANRILFEYYLKNGVL